MAITSTQLRPIPCRKLASKFSLDNKVSFIYNSFVQHSKASINWSRNLMKFSWFKKNHIRISVNFLATTFEFSFSRSKDKSRNPFLSHPILNEYNLTPRQKIDLCLPALETLDQHNLFGVLHKKKLAIGRLWVIWRKRSWFYFSAQLFDLFLIWMRAQLPILFIL